MRKRRRKVVNFEMRRKPGPRNNQATTPQIRRILTLRRAEFSVAEIARSVALTCGTVEKILKQYRDQTRPIRIEDRNHLPHVRALREAVNNGALAKMSAAKLVEEIFGSDRRTP